MLLPSRIFEGFQAEIFAGCMDKGLGDLEGAQGVANRLAFPIDCARLPTVFHSPEAYHAAQVLLLFDH